MTGIETAALMTYATYAAAAIAVVSAVSQSEAQRKAANRNAETREAEVKAFRERAVGQEEQQRAQARQIIGGQLAAGAESGIGLDGSRLQLVEESRLNAELDALSFRYDREVQAVSGLNGAAMSRFEGKQAQSQGYLSAAGAALNGASYYKGSGNLGRGSLGQGTMAGGHSSTVGMNT